MLCSRTGSCSYRRPRSIPGKERYPDTSCRDRPSPADMSRPAGSAVLPPTRVGVLDRRDRRRRELAIPSEQQDAASVRLRAHRMPGKRTGDGTASRVRQAGRRKDERDERDDQCRRGGPTRSASTHHRAAPVHVTSLSRAREPRRRGPAHVAQLLERRLAHGREHRVERHARQRLLLEQRRRGLLDRAPVAVEDVRRRAPRRRRRAARSRCRSGSASRARPSRGPAARRRGTPRRPSRRSSRARAPRDMPNEVTMLRASEVAACKSSLTLVEECPKAIRSPASPAVITISWLSQVGLAHDRLVAVGEHVRGRAELAPARDDRELARRGRVPERLGDDRVRGLVDRDQPALLLGQDVLLGGPGDDAVDRLLERAPGRSARGRRAR